MELGGNAPFVVFDDADIDAAVEGAMLAKMRNGGEACTAANRLHVQNSVREEFTTKLTERIAAHDASARAPTRTPTLGPLINENQLQHGRPSWSTTRLRRARRSALGGKAADGPGYFYPATVLDDVPAQRAILREEMFGPVAAITGFDTEDEAIASPTTPSSASPPNLSRENLDRALRVAEALQTGMVGVNRGVISDAAAPFGGVKAVRFGREGGPKASRSTWRPSTSR